MLYTEKIYSSVLTQNQTARLHKTIGYKVDTYVRGLFLSVRDAAWCVECFDLRVNKVSRTPPLVGGGVELSEIA